LFNFNFNFNLAKILTLKHLEMKTKKNLFAISILFTMLYFASCNSENENSSNENSKQNVTNYEKMDAFFGSKIAVVKGSDLEVVVAKEDVLLYAEEALKDSGLNLKPKNFKIIDENNKKYLRIYSNDNYVSTVELTLENGVYKVAKVVCTSQVCASGGGCVPDGEYCTPCKYSNGASSSDCTRTSTAG
jgi:hypothetical protein